MSSDELERRFKNFQETMLENQARFDERQAQFERNQMAMQTAIDGMREAVAGLIQVARIHGEQIDQNRQQIAALTQQGSEQQERLNALIRIVEGHVSNHP
jgi:hypothetical protein